METPKSQSGRHYLAAVVLGTALAALGQNDTARANDISGQAIQDISRYCTACWRNARLPVDRWGDCTQEVFRRLLERLEPQSWERVLASEGDERKQFIRAIDAVKKRTQRERHGSFLPEEGIADTRDTNVRDRREDRDAFREAVQILSSRQQRILQMTCDGWSIPAIAAELATTPERVSDEKYKAVQKLRRYFHDHPEFE
jgi:RNA polymerase sigma factor (sigma-70 family)